VQHEQRDHIGALTRNEGLLKHLWSEEPAWRASAARLA